MGKLRRKERIREISRICEHTFTDERLVVAALTHPSAAEGRPVTSSYERLEFLGDSVLGSIVALYVYQRFPSMDEGGLSRIKTSLISGNTLSAVGEDLNIAPLLLLGESERGTGARGRKKALEDVYEALVAALYLDGGIEVARKFVQRTLLAPYATPMLAKRPLSPKSRLQEVTQRDYHCGPEYRLVSEEGPAHTPTFTTVVYVEGRRVGRGQGHSKKQSEAASALDALKQLGYLDEAALGLGETLEPAREGMSDDVGAPGDDSGDMEMFVADGKGDDGVS